MIGAETLTVQVRDPIPNVAVPTYKVSMKLRSPVLNVTAPTTTTGIQPQPSVAYNLECNIEFLLPAASTDQARANLNAMVYDLLTNSDPATWAVENLQPSW
jgi:hypothetical protein